MISAENSSGITSMKIRRRKMVPSGWVIHVVSHVTQPASAPAA